MPCARIAVTIWSDSACLTRGSLAPCPINSGLLNVAAESPADAARANRLLVQAGPDVTRLGLEQPSLEETFLNLTQEKP